MVLKNTKVGSGSTMRKKTTNALNGRETAACQRRTPPAARSGARARLCGDHRRPHCSYGEARATDLAKSLGVTHVTVIRTVERLKREGWVATQPSRSIFLTEARRRLAAKARARHQTVIAFLEALGVSPSVARADAEGIEHHVSPETLAVLESFLTTKHRQAMTRARPM